MLNDLLKLSIKEFVKIQKKESLKCKMIDNTASLFRLYSIEQNRSLAEEVCHCLLRLNDSSIPDQIRFELESILKKAHLPLEDDVLSELVEKILLENLIRCSPKAWVRYYSEKATKSIDVITAELKKQSFEINQRLDEILQAVYGKIFTLDGFESVIAKSWGDTKVKINLRSFFQNSGLQ